MEEDNIEEIEQGVEEDSSENLVEKTHAEDFEEKKREIEEDYQEGIERLENLHNHNLISSFALDMGKEEANSRRDKILSLAEKAYGKHERSIGKIKDDLAAGLIDLDTADMRSMEVSWNLARAEYVVDLHRAHFLPDIDETMDDWYWIVEDQNRSFRKTRKETRRDFEKLNQKGKAGFGEIEKEEDPFDWSIFERYIK